MTITGLLANNLLINNPIWVDITDLPNDTPIQITFTQQALNGQVADSTQLKLTPYNLKCEINISPVIKALMDRPKVNPALLVAGQTLETNISRVTIVFDANGPSLTTVTKNFIRGGSRSNRNNVPLPDDAPLSDGKKYPVWEGFKTFKTKLTGNDIVVRSLGANEQVPMIPPFCNALYIVYKNLLGGYSYWVLETFGIQAKSKEGTYVDQRKDGFEITEDVVYEISANGKFTSPFFGYLFSLVESPEIYALNIQEYLADNVDNILAGDTWTRIYKASSSFEIDNGMGVAEAQLRFELKLKHDTSLLW